MRIGPFLRGAMGSADRQVCCVGERCVLNIYAVVGHARYTHTKHGADIYATYALYMHMSDCIDSNAYAVV
ncbi:hypothetical protein PMAC_001585 [Pneumocystis sp. 'macacae']|nr:hypothetical protein PMAC_001585 [Pneumocystis sp. 'macacae']